MPKQGLEAAHGAQGLVGLVIGGFGHDQGATLLHRLAVAVRLVLLIAGLDQAAGDLGSGDILQDLNRALLEARLGQLAKDLAGNVTALEEANDGGGHIKYLYGGV